jgi:hypothetical protein
MFTSSKSSEMARLVAFSVAAAIAFSAAAAEAQAETRVFGCNFVESYNSTQVSSALSQAKAAVGIEAISLYRQYMSLKNECRTNPDAKRSVRLSPDMVALISN